MGEPQAFRVRVRHNVVRSLGPVPMNASVRIPETKLEVSTQLARNHQERGCIDGDYYFDNADRAKYFAILCQDFVKKLVDKTAEELERVRNQPGETWRNPFSPHKDDE
ncbi:MAG: hypothetical protein EXQ86_12170 [Rhodospirillales bacterium]|nr:hypothetical protein [Rhodospirillales bacterium]